MGSILARATTEIRCTISSRVPRIPFETIARDILSERYVLSLVLCGDTLTKRINRTYSLPALKLRQAGKKDYAPNVLSFPLGEYEGEIFLNVRKAEREARAADISARERIALLFVHGCLHLRGMKHGHKMEAEERKVLKRFGFKI
ncbi:MAG: rRNA maturation RNase YbeY [bacterium]|nr:rRNA maturation RNase YbeY [bacterium]